MEKKNRKLQLNKMTVAELNQNEQAAIYGGVPCTVSCPENTMCSANNVDQKDLNMCTLGTDCARSFIGEANCNGEYTKDPKVHSCIFDCNTNKSICVC
jgi:natural product precursor